MIALSFWAGWGIIALAVAGIILFYKVMDLSVEAAGQWWNDRPGADLSANKERES